jgi:DnaK suppressor protein
MDPDRARDLLARERARIEEAMADLRGDEPEAIIDEPGDEGSESLYQDEYDADRARDLAEELAAVERAEARLAAGTYGLSIETGKLIPDERLEAFPTAERTVEELGER